MSNRNTNLKRVFHFFRFIDWISSRPTLLMNTARTKCALPIDLADVPLRKANKDDFRCGDFAKDNLKPIGLFQLEPTEHQVAFEDDSLKLKCRVQVSASQKVRNNSFFAIRLPVIINPKHFTI